jgi:3-hydroxy-9,10-secoandrosta-1,3,5(10)-triene-9,17-dione monooxygenase
MMSALPRTIAGAAETPTGAEMVARARALIPALQARAAQSERDRRLPRQTIDEMQAAGLFRVVQPKRWGGYELDILTFYEVQMALAEADMSVGWVYGVVGVHPWLIAQFDDRVAQEVWGRDSSTLICSSLMPAGAATPVEGGFRFSGRWKYASGCEHTQWAFLGGVIDPQTRGVFVVPKSDYEIVDTWHVSGLKGTGSHDIIIKDAFVPSHRFQNYEDSFHGRAPGHVVNTSMLYRLPFGQIFFRGVSTAAIGALQAMLDVYLGYGKTRIQRGTGQQAAVDPMVQLLCAEVASAIDEMKTILHRNFRALEAYAARHEMPPLAQRIQYKFHSATVAERCQQLAARLFKAAGAAGIYEDHPFGRMLADITAARQHVSNQYEIIGRGAGATLFGIDDYKNDFVL